MSLVVTATLSLSVYCRDKPIPRVGLGHPVQCILPVLALCSCASCLCRCVSCLCSCSSCLRRCVSCLCSQSVTVLQLCQLSLQLCHCLCSCAVCLCSPCVTALQLCQLSVAVPAVCSQSVTALYLKTEVFSLCLKTEMFSLCLKTEVFSLFFTLP